MTTQGVEADQQLGKRTYALVDPFFNLPPDPTGEKRPMDPNIARWFKDSKALFEGATIEQMLADMDKAGIERGLVCTMGSSGSSSGNFYKVGMNVTEESWEAGVQRVAEAVAKSNGRLYGHMFVDPTDGMTTVRRLERSVKEFGFIACGIMPALIGLPPNHACYFPVYAKCVELGIPIKINVGVPGPLRPGWVQRPIHLDEVLIAFPELTVVGTHVGHPWHLETVALLQKHANFRLITSGWAPRHVPEEIWRVANTRAAHKVMWSSDYPILPMERCANEGWDVALKDEVRRRYLRENALEVFKMG